MNANSIKKQIKAAGITTKGVSVRVETSSVDCRIKNLSVDKEAVDSILNQYEKIDRCQYTGDILQGGNTFVNVDYDHATIHELAKSEEFLSLINAWIDGMTGQGFRNDLAKMFANENQMENVSNKALQMAAREWFAQIKNIEKLKEQGLQVLR